MNVPDTEKQMGIELYCSSVAGIGGELRQKPEDFIVKEITNREENETGKYLIVEVTKKNWDTNHLMRDISRKLGISQKRISFAGTKDKRAVTTQKISIYDMTKEAIDSFYMKDVELKVIGRSNKAVELGNLYGNEFTITIRNIDHSAQNLERILADVTKDINDFGGVPNFFGIQRFGAVRPITHLIGEQILKGDFENAALLYIAKSFPDEHEETKNARNHVWETRDFVEGLKIFPLRLRYERAMMHHLVEHPGDFAGSFGVLSKNISKMFVHAYQSYIFNKIICQRIRDNIPLSSAVPGDIVCFKNKEGLPDTKKLQMVDDENVDGMNNLVKRKRAFVTAPLVGYKSDFASGIPGTIEANIFESVDIPVENFKIKAVPELSSKGLRREILLQCEPVFEIEDDELNHEKNKVTLNFALPKGSYATTVLREYMKVEPLKMS